MDEPLCPLPPSIPHVPPQAAAMHSDCIFKKEQAMCLEKIQRANDLMGLNDSSPGKESGGKCTESPAHPVQSLELGSSLWPPVESAGGCRSLGPSEGPLG